ncbi:hypothetical protein KC336_g19884, partial [Hortaea werneckii]
MVEKAEEKGVYGGSNALDVGRADSAPRRSRLQQYSSFTAHDGPARPPRIPQQRNQRNTLPLRDSLISTDLVTAVVLSTPFHLFPQRPTVAYSTPANTAFEATNSAVPNNLSNHRRRTSRGVHAPSQGGRPSNLSPSKTTFQNTPFEEEDVEEAAPRSSAADYAFAPAPAGAAMSLDHSPSPQRGGGWSSPGLTTPYEDANPGSGAVSRSRSPTVKSFGDLNGGGPGGA